jgi:hypothetical protein
MYFRKISRGVDWSMEAKNFLMSHLSIQHVWVLFQLALYANDRKRFRALCVPLFFRQEYESAMKMLSKMDTISDGWRDALIGLGQRLCGCLGVWDQRF